MNVEEIIGSVGLTEILDGLPVLVFLERAGTILFANAEARGVLGVEPWREQSVEEVLWGFYAGTAEPRTQVRKPENGSAFHASLRIADGQRVAVEGTYRVLDVARREAVIVACRMGQDEKTPGWMEEVLTSLPEAVAIEHGGRVLYTNAAFSTLFGYASEEVGGKNLRELIVPETRWSEYATLERAVDERGRITVETVRMNREGDLIDVCQQCAPLEVKGSRIGYVHSYRNIAERKQTESMRQHDAMHDVLTGLPNRALFQDRLKLSLSRRLRRPEQNCGVLVLDLDHFREMNEALGRAAGDALLVSVAERLSATLRPQDTAARMSGDEFAVLLENMVSLSDLETVARRVLGMMEDPFEIFGHPVAMSISLGAAIAEPSHESGEPLLRNADRAMFLAKQAGGAQYRIFETKQESQTGVLEEEKSVLRARLEQRKFEIFYQPVFRMEDGRLEFFEAVLRDPGAAASAEGDHELMNLAERAGLSVAWGAKMLDAVCRQLRAWSAMARPVPVALHLTRRQFQHPDLIPQLERALAEHGIDPEFLILEIAESVLTEKTAAAQKTITTVAEHKARVAIVDFGSEQASLQALAQLPVAIIKLDARLVTATGRQQAVLEALVQIGRMLGISVVAQGIETHEQLQNLAHLGCTLGQGPLLARALSVDEATRLADEGFWSAASAL